MILYLSVVYLFHLNLLQTVQGATCYYQCLTCTNGNDCATCNSTSLRTLNTVTCPCNPGYFDDGGNQLCGTCNYQCGTCNGGSNQNCTNCNSTTSFRTLNNISSTDIQCGCNAGYFDNGVENCVACSFACGNCTGSSKTSCTTCQTGSHRSLDDTTCSCDPGYYHSGVAICATCNYQCGTCRAGGGTNQSCIYCNSTTSFRTLIYISSTNTQCGCNVGYFDNGVENCVACQYSCGNCTAASKSSCTTCQSTSQRFLNSNGYCSCNSGYYDDGLSATCAACSYSCGNCTAASKSSCTTCQSTSQRFLSSGSCTCNSGYFDDGLSAICAPCSYSCDNCSAASKAFCTTCQINSQRFLSNGSCTCFSGYFDDGSNPICAPCFYSCGNCTAPPKTSCTSCYINSLRFLSSGSCTCNSGYFDDGLQATCNPCSYQCENCTSAANTTCQTCQQNSFRTLKGKSCPCDTNYLDNGSQAICTTVNCPQTCATCSFGAAICTSCSSSQNRFLTNGQCHCNAGFYDDGTNANCDACSYSCGNCTAASKTSCTTCQTNSLRFFSGGSCTCNSGYYDQASKAGTTICQQCHYSCMICIDRTTLCVSCSAKNFRELAGSSPNLCKCSNGYFDNGDYMCEASLITNSVAQIKPTCSQNNCLECPKEECHQCMQGYFLHENNCINCDQRCLDCTGPLVSQCLKCTFILQEGTCSLCEEIIGLVTIKKNCESLCGDSIIRFDKGEQCDDGNQLSNDGCSSSCQVEPDFICLPQKVPSQLSDHNQFVSSTKSFCYTSQDQNLQLIYTENTNNNILSLIFNQNIYLNNFCDSFQINIQSLSKTEYTFDSLNQTLNSCSIILHFRKSLKANQIIELDFNDTLKDKHGVNLTTRHTQLLSKTYTYYSPEQQAQAQTVVQGQSILNYLIFCLGLFIIFFGGVETYWAILDIMTWVDTLYFINVNYPLNVKEFFKYASWTDILQIPSLIILNSPADDYYQPGPPKFHDKGFSGCFLASVQGDIYFCMAGLMVYLMSLFVCLTIEKVYTLKPNPNIQISSIFKLGGDQDVKIFENKITNNFSQKIHLNIPGLLKPLYNQCNIIKSNSMNIFVKLILLVFLDFQMASILQIKAGQFTKHLFISLNTIISIITLGCSLCLPYFFYSVINQSNSLLHYESYKANYSAIYEDVRVEERQGKFYCVFLVLKKSIFVIFLTYLYEKPIWQSITCTLASSLNILLICYNSPFENKFSLIKNLIPEIAVFGSLATTIIFALDDSTQFLEMSTKFLFGWFILFLILSSVLIQCIFLLQLIGVQMMRRFHILYDCLLKKN